MAIDAGHVAQGVRYVLPPAVTLATMLHDEMAESQMATLHGVVGATRSLQARVAGILPPLAEQAVELLVAEGSGVDEQQLAELVDLLQSYSAALKQRCRVGSVSVMRVGQHSGLTAVSLATSSSSVVVVGRYYIAD
jgi:hypothetical protein